MAFCIKRREFVGLLGGATVAWPFVALAQKPDRSRRIGVLMSLGENDPGGSGSAFRIHAGACGFGLVRRSKPADGCAWGGGDVNKIRTFAKELVAMQPDVILAQGTPVTAALQRETHTIPIVFVVVTDPVGEGFVAGLPLPGGNITGFITSEAAMGSKMLDLLLDIAPGINRVAMMFNPDTAPGGGKYYLGDFEAAARSSRISADRSACSKRCRNRNRCDVAWTRTRWRSRCHAGLFHAEPCPANLVASSAKQRTHDLPVEVSS
jgi:ABC-type uncharacterized transport system, periplasmic component